MMAQCIQCVEMNLNDKDKYGDAFCKYYRKYYDPYSSACSHIEYSDSSLRNREDEYENEDSGCYLTTIVCKVLGHEDQHPVLNTMRNFRDQVLQQQEEYYPILNDYDHIGPIIAMKIDHDPQKQILSKLYYDYYLIPVTKCIEQNDYTLAVQIYTHMTQSLICRYHLQEIYHHMKENGIKESFCPKTAGHGLIKK